MLEKLTTQQYRESYSATRQINKERLMSVYSYYDSFWGLFIDDKKSNQTLIEINDFLISVYRRLIFKAHRLFLKFVVNPYLMKRPSRFLSVSIIVAFEKH
ncbi:hypothetical protein A9Q86_05100 [Flavobacteriales bacterium 33_180_T64]|nr:hypothetical protein A9Q86_05100 [Flavobacteriales bacterium 33_180_T64]